MNAIPNSTSGSGTITLETYEGSTLLGTDTSSFTLNVPNTIIPTISAATASVVNPSEISSWGVYVQGYSQAKIAISALGSYSSTIVKYNITGEQTLTGTTSSITSDALMNSGSRSFTVTVTDSRGRTSEAKTVTVFVNAYAKPSFISATAFRSDSAGTATESGTYIKAYAVFSYNPVGSNNTVTATYAYQKLGDPSWTEGMSSAASNISYIFGNGGISTASSYIVKMTLTDKLNTVEKIINIGTAAYAMFFKAGGNGVAFGKVSEKEKAVEIAPDWSFYHGATNVFSTLNTAYTNASTALDKVNKIVYTTGTAPTNYTTGTIWLKKKT